MSALTADQAVFVELIAAVLVMAVMTVRHWANFHEKITPIAAGGIAASGLTAGIFMMLAAVDSDWLEAAGAFPPFILVAGFALAMHSAKALREIWG